MNNTTITTTEDLNRHFAEIGLSADWCDKTWKVSGDNNNGYVITENSETDVYTLVHYSYDEDAETRTDRDIVDGSIDTCITIHSFINITKSFVKEQNEAGMLAFSEACYNQNSLSELQEALFLPADETDMREWNINSEEYYIAIKEAIESKLAE